MVNKQFLPKRGARVLVIDPVPPPSPAQIAKGLRDKDYEVIMVGQRTGNEFFCCEYKMKKGHTPNWTIAMFFQLAIKWRVQKVWVESVNYQRTLKWLIEQAMQKKGIFFPVEERPGANRSKYDKIVDPLSGPMSNGACYIHESMTELRSQILNYPDVSNDDVIECWAMCVEALSTGAILEGEVLNEDDIEDLPTINFCP